MPQRFGDMLISRRREMGMSIQQVSNITKIRPQIIEYVETENFDALPNRGYAQGIVSSYARFLGLDPNTVVNAYFDALEEYQQYGSDTPSNHYQDAASEANFRSSQAMRRYHLVNTVRPASRYAQRPPQAGYVSESSSPHEPLSAERLRPRAEGGLTRRRPQPTDGELASRGQSPRSDSASRGGRTPYGGRSERGGANRGRPAQDMRRSSRGSQARGGGVPPRTRSGRGGRSGGGQGRVRRSLDPRLIALVAFILLALIAVFAFFMLRGCAPKPETSQGSTTTSVQKTDTDASPASDSMDSDADSASTDADSADSDKTDPAVPEETVVKVRVKEEGVVAWIEVKLDGRSVLAKQVVGPFEQEFTVEDQIGITTDTPNEVTVYQNGKKVRYDTKVSGVAKVSITAPKPETVDLTVDTDDDGIADMTAEDAAVAGYDVEGRTVATVTVTKAEYEAGKFDSDE